MQKSPHSSAPAAMSMLQYRAGKRVDSFFDHAPTFMHGCVHVWLFGCSVGGDEAYLLRVHNACPGKMTPFAVGVIWSGLHV